MAQRRLRRQLKATNYETENFVAVATKNTGRSVGAHHLKTQFWTLLKSVENPWRNDYLCAASTYLSKMICRQVVTTSKIRPRIRRGKMREIRANIKGQPRSTLGVEFDEEEVTRWES